MASLGVVVQLLCALGVVVQLLLKMESDPTSFEICIHKSMCPRCKKTHKCVPTHVKLPSGKWTRLREVSPPTAVVAPAPESETAKVEEVVETPQAEGAKTEDEEEGDEDASSSVDSQKPEEEKEDVEVCDAPKAAPKTNFRHENFPREQSPAIARQKGGQQDSHPSHGPRARQKTSRGHHARPVDPDGQRSLSRSEQKTSWHHVRPVADGQRSRSRARQKTSQSRPVDRAPSEQSRSISRHKGGHQQARPVDPSSSSVAKTYTSWSHVRPVDRSPSGRRSRSRGRQHSRRSADRSDQDPPKGRWARKKERDALEKEQPLDPGAAFVVHPSSWKGPAPPMPPHLPWWFLKGMSNAPLLPPPPPPDPSEVVRRRHRPVAASSSSRPPVLREATPRLRSRSR